MHGSWLCEPRCPVYGSECVHMDGVYAVGVGVWMPLSLGLYSMCAHTPEHLHGKVSIGAGAEAFQENVCGLMHRLGGDGLRQPRRLRWTGGWGEVQGVQENVPVSSLLKLSFGLPALCWHQAVLKTQELVVA